MTHGFDYPRTLSRMEKAFPQKEMEMYSVAVLSKRTRFSSFVFLYSVWSHRNVLAFYCYGVNAFSIDRKIKIRKVRTYIWSSQKSEIEFQCEYRNTEIIFSCYIIYFVFLIARLIRIFFFFFK